MTLKSTGILLDALIKLTPKPNPNTDYNKYMQAQNELAVQE